jgi:hypothetical protein
MADNVLLTDASLGTFGSDLEKKILAGVERLLANFKAEFNKEFTDFKSEVREKLRHRRSSSGVSTSFSTVSKLEHAEVFSRGISSEVFSAPLVDDQTAVLASVSSESPNVLEQEHISQPSELFTLPGQNLSSIPISLLKNVRIADSASNTSKPKQEYKNIESSRMREKDVLDHVGNIYVVAIYPFDRGKKGRREESG